MEGVEKGEGNSGFDPSPEKLKQPRESKNQIELEEGEKKAPERQQWDNPMEFLMSCIATSVGLGNVWRFPFVAYNNGGGAFLIPYIIVLFLVGKPMYYLETFLGTFSSSNCVKVWALSPALKGTGYVQALTGFYVLSYYVSIIALCLFYFAMSFQSTLPWAVCQPEWERCVPSGESATIENGTSSAEYYFINTVLREPDGIHGGLGYPLWDLTLCLFASWFIIFVIVSRGVKSSGKAAYFLALFPYVILFILLIRAVTLPGSGAGILFFITPQWEKIAELDVWYAAVTQVFFSLSVCSGALIMFSSYNKFGSNVYRDSMIVTTLDTFTSLLSGVIIFGVLGNLAYELGYGSEINKVIGSGGTSLAFISYPDAIAKSPFLPQLFSVLFFVMLGVLGVGSGVAGFSNVNSVFLDAMPNVRPIIVTSVMCFVGFLAGLVYVTPGGQYILQLVDHYGGTFLRLFAALCEVIGVFWIYGLENVCRDVEFMLGIKTSFYWRLCWGFITPLIMGTVFIYALVKSGKLTYGEDYIYPDGYYVFGNVMLYVGMAIIPLFIFITLYKRRSAGSWIEVVKKSFSKKETYGPLNPEKFEEWQAYRAEQKLVRQENYRNRFHHWFTILFRGYSK